MIARRSILTGLVALVAAPAIVKVGQVMAINSGLVPGDVSMRYIENYWAFASEPARVDVLYGRLTVDQITRDAVRLFRHSNEFLRNMDRQYDVKSGVETNARYQANKIGDTLRIRLPNDYVVSDGPSLSMQEPVNKVVHILKAKNADEWEPWGQVEPLAPVALAAAALVAAPEILKTPVTRRFWSK